MTREVFTPSPIYTISGTGPYTIQHPYQVASEIRATIFQGVNIVDLAPANFTVSPGSSATTGDVTITSAIATMYAGASLVIRRVTVADQGWAGQTAREKGLEAQLDALTQRMQEVDEAIGRAIKVPDGAVAELPLDLASSFPFFDAGGNLVLASGLVTGVPVTPYMVSLLDDVDALTARGTLGLRIGTDVQAYSAVLSSTTASFTTAMLTNLNNQSGINTGDEPNATEAAYGVTLQATYTDAIAGTQNTKYMTPLRTAQAITALGPAATGEQHIETRTIVGGETALAFSGYGGYKTIRIAITDIVLSASTTLRAQVSTDGGTTFLTAGYSSQASDPAGSTGLATGLLKLAAARNQIENGTVWLSDFNGPRETQSLSILKGAEIASGYCPAGVNDAFQLSVSAGDTFTSGRIEIYGVLA